MTSLPPIDLDAAATTRLSMAARGVLVEALDAGWGNPSSRHARGAAARAAVEEARRQVARAVGADPAAVCFTSGGTEANALAVLGGARAGRARVPGGATPRVLFAPDEHACVRNSAESLVEEGFEVRHLPVDRAGALDLEAAAELLHPHTVLVSCVLINNEIGRLHPVRRLARLVRARSPRAQVHTDAVQAFGKIELDLEELGVDTLALSAHKVHGPQGVGALVRRSAARLEPLAHGGGQEAGLRPGTEPAPLLAAFGVAAAEAEEQQAAFLERARGLRARLAENLAPGCALLECGEAVPMIAALLLPGPPAEVWQHHLEERGVCIGVGSACSSGSRELSPTLAALGLDARAGRQVARLSFARTTTPEEVDAALAALRAVERELGALRP
jgi:cysteine desulfurase